MLVYLLHLTDSTLHSGEDVRALAKLPCFALVPELTRRDLRTTPIEEFVLRRPLTAYAEQIRAVRAGLWSGVERPRVVAVTAARPSEGKSVLALSLARSAALSGEKVLLIDCDMRRPSLGHRLRVANGPGLADLLRGDNGMLDVLHNDQSGAPGGGMHFVPAGQPRGDTFGLFMGAETASRKLLLQPSFFLYGCRFPRGFQMIPEPDDCRAGKSLLTHGGGIERDLRQAPMSRDGLYLVRGASGFG